MLIYWVFYSNAGLYTTFIFQKPDPEIAPPITTPILQDASYNLDEVINDYYEFIRIYIYILISFGFIFLECVRYLFLFCSFT